MDHVVELYLSDIRLLRPEDIEAKKAYLSPARREKINACRRPRERLRRAAAGLLLYSVLNIGPEESLQRNEYGKPMLTVGGRHFNLSYAGNYAVLALAHTPVGVDIEPLDNGAPLAVPKKVLRADELAWLEEHQTTEHFLTLWTRLESAVKADGRGLGMEERTFSVIGSSCPWQMKTVSYDGHVISCALREPFQISVRPMP